MIRFSDRSLRTQIAIVCGLVAFAVAGILSVTLGEMLRANARADASTALHDVAFNTARLLSLQVQTRSTQVAVLSSSESLWDEGLQSDESRAALERSRTILAYNDWVGLADMDGIVQSATGGILVGESVRERPWFDGGRDGLYVGDVHLAQLLASKLPASSDGSPRRFVDFAAPVFSRGVAIGVLTVHANWQWARDVIDDAMPARKANRGLEVFIFDRDGWPIYAPGGTQDALRAAGQRLPLSAGAASRAESASAAPPARAAAAIRPATEVRWADGKTYLTAAAAVPAANSTLDLGWQVVAREPIEVAYASARDASWAALLVGAAAAALALLTAAWAAGRLSRDLWAMSKAAQELEAGTHGAALPVFPRASREVRVLSSTLHAMTERLLQANERMEEQVRLRTQELEAANSELDRQSRTDPLTGLLNRRGFDERLRQSIDAARRYGRPLSAVMLDADHFKSINDRFGHEGGDQVLRFLAERLVSRSRATDIVARLGGEEFVLLLPETDAAGASVLAQALVDDIGGTVHPVWGRVTISAGVAEARGAVIDGEMLLQQADTMLYAAKAQGRNRVCTAGA